jgi:hypothetical protein
MYPETMFTGRHFAMLVLLSLLSREVHAETSTNEAMTASQMQGAVFLDSLSMPSPGEVFSALNKNCHPSWASLVTPSAAPVSTDRSQLALGVGVLAADGYIAVQAQDGQQVKNIGMEIMAVAKSLGIGKNLMSRGNSLIEFAKNSAWDSLADELEVTESEVKRTMVEQKDHALVTLTSAAAWLRGIDVATKIILADDSLRGISVIRQPQMARQLSSQIEELPERIKRDGLDSKLIKCLDSVAVNLETMGNLPEEERLSLQKIHRESALMVGEIMASPALPLRKMETGIPTASSKP